MQNHQYTVFQHLNASSQGQASAPGGGIGMGMVQFPEQEQLRCPRCDSTNTKFCYYNNYNLSQPRHFCKACRRYWTKGGALRNIPVGGGSRKNSNSSASKRSSSTTSGSKNNSPPTPKRVNSETSRSFPSDLALSSPTEGDIHRDPTTAIGLDNTDAGGSVSSFGGPGQNDHIQYSMTTTRTRESSVVDLNSGEDGTTGEDYLSSGEWENGRGGGHGGWPELSIFSRGPSFQ